MANNKTEKKSNIQDFGYRAKDVYIEKYYKFPSFLMSNSNYSSMTDSTKITYMLFKNEFRRALHEKWIDEKGILYLEFTQKRLMALLNCYQGKVAKIITELEEYGLIEVVKGEFNTATRKNEKSRYYLLQPNITADDLFIQNDPSEQIGRSDDNSFTNASSLNSDRNAKIALRSQPSETVDNPGNAKIAFRTQPSETVDNPGNAKIAQHYYINKSLDTNRHYKDTEKADIQDKILLDNFVEIMKDKSIATFIPEKVLTLIRAFSSDYTEAQQTVKTIHNAKHKAEQMTGVHILFEDLDRYGINAEYEMYNTLLKAYQKQKTEKVENMQNLIFTYVKNWFVEEPTAAIEFNNSTKNLPPITLLDNE